MDRFSNAKGISETLLNFSKKVFGKKSSNSFLMKVVRNHDIFVNFVKISSSSLRFCLKTFAKLPTFKTSAAENRVEVDKKKKT